MSDIEWKRDSKNTCWIVACQTQAKFWLVTLNAAAGCFAYAVCPDCKYVFSVGNDDTYAVASILDMADQEAFFDD